MGVGAETGTELQKVSSNSPQILTKKNHKAKSCSMYLSRYPSKLYSKFKAGTCMYLE